mgnify:CR=1 FL=1
MDWIKRALQRSADAKRRIEEEQELVDGILTAADAKRRMEEEQKVLDGILTANIQSRADNESEDEDEGALGVPPVAHDSCIPLATVWSDPAEFQFEVMTAYEMSTYPLFNRWEWQGLSDPFYRVVTAKSPSFAEFNLDNEATDSHVDRFFEFLEISIQHAPLEDKWDEVQTDNVTGAATRLASRVYNEVVCLRAKTPAVIFELSMFYLSMAATILKCEQKLGHANAANDPLCSTAIQEVVEAATAVYPAAWRDDIRACIAQLFADRT